MKIESIAGAKHPTKRKGDVIELSPEKKICLMAKEQLAQVVLEGYKYIPIKADVVGIVDVFSGRKIKGKEDPCHYTGKARVKFRKLRLYDDRLFPTEEAVVSLTCKDCRDDMGVPDLEIVKFQILK